MFRASFTVFLTVVLIELYKMTAQEQKEISLVGSIQHSTCCPALHLKDSIARIVKHRTA